MLEFWCCVFKVWKVLKFWIKCLKVLEIVTVSFTTNTDWIWQNISFIKWWNKSFAAARARLFPAPPAALAWFHTQLDSIESWCVCVHLTSSQTHDRKQTECQYIVFLINLVLLCAAEWTNRFTVYRIWLSADCKRKRQWISNNLLAWVHALTYVCANRLTLARIQGKSSTPSSLTCVLFN